MKPDTLNQEVGILVRREIEARILKPFFEAVAEEIGLARAEELLARVVKQAATEVGRAMRDQAGSDDIEAFAGQWEPWFRGGALEIEEHERNNERWRFNVTRCRYAELYQALGMAHLGQTLSCNRDAALIEGFSEEIELKRTQTIMEGASHCDFHYRRKLSRAF
jgi:predicted ArsR family transcriptional regulator